MRKPNFKSKSHLLFVTFVSLFIYPLMFAKAANKKYIQHPESVKGLRMIDRDGSYYYETQKMSSNDKSSSVRFGSLQPTPNIEAENGLGDYRSIYGSSNPFTLSYDYEWKPWKRYGSLGLQLGFNMFTGSGNGVFVSEDTVNGENDANEKFTIFAVPLNAGLIYRFQYIDNQWFVPFIAGGGSLIGFVELRDDSKGPSFAMNFGGYGAGGLMVNLSAIDRQTGFNLDSEYGIHTMWLTGEIRQLQVTKKDLDISGTILTFGFGMDY